MSGPMSRVVYTSDNTQSYSLKMPTWVATLTGAADATTEPGLPKGFRPRRRYFRVTATGKEGSFVCPTPTTTQYTADAGTGVIVPQFESALATAANATLAGARGEGRRQA